MPYELRLFADALVISNSRKGWCSAKCRQSEDDAEWKGGPSHDPQENTANRADDSHCEMALDATCQIIDFRQLRLDFFFK